jgi:hypothetical protein
VCSSTFFIGHNVGDILMCFLIHQEYNFVFILYSNILLEMYVLVIHLWVVTLSTNFVEQRDVVGHVCRNVQATISFDFAPQNIKFLVTIIDLNSGGIQGLTYRYL